MLLGKGHGAGVKPHVDDVRHAAHAAAAFRADQMHRVHVGAVQLNGLINRTDFTRLSM